MAFIKIIEEPIRAVFVLYGKIIKGLFFNSLFFFFFFNKIKNLLTSILNRSTLEPLAYCENTYGLICKFMNSKARFGRGRNFNIMLDKEKIAELIKAKLLVSKDGDQFDLSRGDVSSFFEEVEDNFEND